MNALSACAVLAVLELDATLVAQTLVSRPLVAGTLVGALTGDAGGGFLYGAAFELLSLGDLPVGGSLTWSGTVAAGVAAMLGSKGLFAPACFAAGIGAGVLHARIEGRERARRTTDSLDEGSSLGRSLFISIARHAATTFLVAAAVVGLISFVDQRARGALPDFVAAGLAVAAASASWLGLAAVAARGLNRA